MYSILFAVTFLFFSYMCFMIDLLAPHMRIKKFTRNIICKEYCKMCPVVGLNMIIGHIFFLVCDKYLINQNNKRNFFINVGLWFILADFIFYCVHRVLHTKRLYWIHKIHHEYIHTFGMGAIYSHPIEFVAGNLLPLAAPIFIFNIPRVHSCIILVYSTAYTVVISHGGYINDNTHYIHHIKRYCNYGIGISDKIFRTEIKNKTPQD